MSSTVGGGGSAEPSGLKKTSKRPKCDLSFSDLVQLCFSLSTYGSPLKILVFFLLSLNADRVFSPIDAISLKNDYVHI